MSKSNQMSQSFVMSNDAVRFATMIMTGQGVSNEDAAIIAECLVEAERRKTGIALAASDLAFLAKLSSDHGVAELPQINRSIEPTTPNANPKQLPKRGLLHVDLLLRKKFCSLCAAYPA